jgi:periplasmic mercuric ion binding protein
MPTNTNQLTMVYSMTRKRTPVYTSLFLALLLGIAVVPQVQAQDKIENPDVTLAVDGLACPFCAYGLEKKLKKLDGVEALEVDMDEGEVRMKFKEGATVSEEQLNKAAADAGFTVTEISYAAKQDTSGEGGG